MEDTSPQHAILDFINMATTNAKSRIDYAIKLARRFRTDPDKDARLRSQKCRSCYYSSQIGGAAMTKSNCQLCGKEMWSTSTNVDSVCRDCAVHYEACVHCGADMALKARRKL